MLYASPQRFEHAVDIHKQYSDHNLSFTDAMTVAMIEYHDIEAVVSFDDDFDGVVNRLAPETVAASGE